MACCVVMHRRTRLRLGCSALLGRSSLFGLLHGLGLAAATLGRLLLRRHLCHRRRLRRTLLRRSGSRALGNDDTHPLRRGLTRRFVLLDADAAHTRTAAALALRLGVTLNCGGSFGVLLRVILRSSHLGYACNEFSLLQ